MTNLQLAIAVEKEIAGIAQAPTDASGNPIFDAETIGFIIEAHQSKFPGSWQDWTAAAKLPVIVKIIKKAIKNKEVSPERIALLCA